MRNTIKRRKQLKRANRFNELESKYRAATITAEEAKEFAELMNLDVGLTIRLVDRVRSGNLFPSK